MAKGSAMGIWRGKKGSTIFYKLSNSNNAQKQGIRERVYEIKNPQSDGQAAQRMKLLPAQRVAGVLREIVERGFQGVEYGSPSRNQYLKYALSMSEGFPYIDKDDDRVIPGKYLISKGTLPSVSISFLNPGMADSIAVSSLLIEQGVPTQSGLTIAALSSSLIDQNPGLAEGDQLTIVNCVATHPTESFDPISYEDSLFSWYYFSFYLSTEDVRPVSDILPSGFSFESAQNDYGYNLGWSQILIPYGIVASACIISRLGSSGQHLRSTSVIALDDVALPNFFNNTRKTAARKTYQKQNQETTNTNWPVEPDIDTSGTILSTYTLEGFTGDLASVNGKKVLVRINEDTNALAAVYYKFGSIYPTLECLVQPSGATITYATTGGDQGELSVSAVTALASLPKVLYTGS